MTESLYLKRFHLLFSFCFFFESSSCAFGTRNALQIQLLLLSDCCGGYCGWGERDIVVPFVLFFVSAHVFWCVLGEDEINGAIYMLLCCCCCYCFVCCSSHYLCVF